MREISHLGGTILGTTNRGNPFCRPTKQPDGTIKELDRSDALIAVGGDGCLSIARKLQDKGLRVIGVPKTIDKDLESTVLAFGFNTAISGWIALHSGLAGRADAILIPEITYAIDKVAAHLRRKHREGKPCSIVVVAEGAKPVGGDVTVRSRKASRTDRLGGIGETVAAQLQELIGTENRCVVLGHLLRVAYAD